MTDLSAPPESATVHELLRRQVAQHIGALAPFPAGWEPFLRAVSAAYEDADEARALLERARVAGEALRESDLQFRMLAETIAAATFL
ncbi:MAG TPA: hypothetical protein VFX98_19065, partial [Longimicrobiaceae bacterium]|nr:hypothetical protein [Longimicrobiaceae bacterium]